MAATSPILDLSRRIDGVWNESIVPALVDYIRIPNKSPSFDPRWREHGHMERATTLIADWCRARAIAGLTVEIVRLEGRTPVIWMEIPATAPTGADTVLLYGHLDKQPEFSGWEDGLGPWIPVMRGERLYGRGGADDGYAAFASLAAIEALQAAGVPHARCVVLIEACEESGSVDLPAYIEALSTRIGTPSLVVCLDSGCGDWDRMWSTTSLRGLVGGNLVVETIKEGVHSGDASGIVPSSFRVLRRVLSRLEDDATGRIVDPFFHVDIPSQRVEQARLCAQVLGDAVWSKFPWHEGCKPMAEDPTELLLNRTWRPALSITGARGFPDLDAAGNTLRPLSAVKISLRVPPTLDPKAALARLKELFEREPPHGARVRFEGEKASTGWHAPELASWLAESQDRASRAAFGNAAVCMGEGGSIPFMGMLGRRYPQAQFLITGVLGPHSNAHGPNEFLDVPTGRKLTACVAQVVADHARRA